jgi:hypothetical protein
MRIEESAVASLAISMTDAILKVLEVRSRAALERPERQGIDLGWCTDEAPIGSHTQSSSPRDAANFGVLRRRRKSPNWTLGSLAVLPGQASGNGSMTLAMPSKPGSIRLAIGKKRSRIRVTELELGAR